MIDQLMVGMLYRHDKEARDKVIRHISGMLRVGRIYEYPAFVKHLSDALDAIADGKDANAALMPIPKGKPKTGDAYSRRRSIAELVRHYSLNGNPLKDSRDRTGAYELTRQHIEAQGEHMSAANIQTAYLEHRETLEKLEHAYREGTIPEMREPWWLPYSG